ncbi:MAG: ankyrin repeat domain-containing protein, partial [Alphaproteobacteria bacterium]|nr:ankyrin repeat domain-containing protein [Alphaproteobacteria bacterium]
TKLKEWISSELKGWISPSAMSFNNDKDIILNTEGRDPYEYTPLMHAVSLGDEELVKIFLNNGANPNLQKDTSPLMIALRSGREDLVSKLVEKKGADVNAADKSGKTPLMIAVESGREDLVSKLVEKGADVDAADKSGKTPLMIAVDSVNKENPMQSFVLMKALIPDEETRKDRLNKFLFTGNSTRVKNALYMSADVNAKDNRNGNTAIIDAAGWGKEDIVKILLEEGGDINQKHNKGETVLQKLKKAQARFAKGNDGVDALSKDPVYQGSHAKVITDKLNKADKHNLPKENPEELKKYQEIEKMIKKHQNKDLATRIQAGLYQGSKTVPSAIGFSGAPTNASGKGSRQQ